MTSAKSYEQIHLRGRGFSNRGIRYRLLPADMTTHIEAQVARVMPKDPTQIEFGAAIVKMGLEEMIIAITEPVVADKLAEATWTTVTPEEVKASWDKFFNAKDTEFLRQLYTSEHTVSKSEIDEIMSGKVSFAP